MQTADVDKLVIGVGRLQEQQRCTGTRNDDSEARWLLEERSESHTQCSQFRGSDRGPGSRSASQK